MKLPTRKFHVIATEKAIKAYEADGVVWLHALTSADVDVDGMPVPFGDLAFFAEVCGSIVAQVEGSEDGVPIFQPPYLVSHDDDPTKEGYPPVTLGLVRRAKIVTRYEMQAQGIATRDALHLMLGVELNALGRTFWSEGRLTYGSVGMRLGREENRLNAKTRTWPGWLDEFSATPKPRFKDLRPVADTQALRFAASDPESTMTPEQLKAALDAMSPEERNAMLAGYMPSANDAVTPVEEPPMTATDGDHSGVSISAEDYAKLQADRTELSNLRGKVEAMERDRLRERTIAELDADRYVIRAADGTLNDDLVGTLVAIRATDEKRYLSVVAGMRKDQRQPTERAAKSGGAPQSTGSPHQDRSARRSKRAHEIIAEARKEGREITMVDAHKKARREDEQANG